MNYIPFIHFARLVNILFKNGRISLRTIPHLLPWLVKTVLLEPLRWIELILFERKIHRHHIPHPPVFIVGHYRSGTTYLQRIFMKDGRMGHMSIFQSVLPEIMLGFEKALTPLLQFVCDLFKVKNPFHRIPFTWQFPGEDDVGMTAMINRHAAQWGVLFPRRSSYYFNKYVLFTDTTVTEKEEWKKDYTYLLKKISLRNKGKRLVLKSPPNTARIKELLELFPGASLIFIHRNPFEVYASTRRFWQVIQKNYILGSPGRTGFSGLMLSQYRDMMNSYLQYRSLIPAAQLAEVSYKDLVNDPVATVELIYKTLALPDMQHCRGEMEKFIKEQKGYHRLEHTLSNEEEGMIAHHWGHLLKEWNYSITPS